MKKVLNKIQLNIKKKIGKINPKKINRCLLVILVIFVWLVVGISFYIRSSINKVNLDLADVSYERTEFENKIREMVEGYPIEKMSRHIANQNKTTAAFMIAIAKKESNWGERKPVLNGKDCYNYWGYRGQREKMGSGGHTCFDSSKDAVRTVAGRIDELVLDHKFDVPGKMIVWKCGSNCDNHDPESVKKWIADVELYYRKLISQ